MMSVLKLNLTGSMFWQSKIVDGKKIYKQVEYRNKDMQELNNIYLRQIGDNIFAEITTNSVVKISKDNRYGFSYPRGVIIDTHKLTPSSYHEATSAYMKIRKNSLQAEYLTTIRDLLVNSNYCEYAKDKKKNMLLKKIKLSSNK